MSGETTNALAASTASGLARMLSRLVLTPSTSLRTVASECSPIHRLTTVTIRP